VSWRRLRTLVQREVRATFRDPFTVVILVTVPLAAMLTFGFVLSTEVSALRLAVIDADDTPASRRLVADIDASEAFEVRRVHDRSALERGLVGGAVRAALVIPPGFARHAAAPDGVRVPEVQLSYDGSEAVLAGNAEGFLQALVAASGGVLVGRERGAPVTVVTRALFNPRLDGRPFMVAGVFGFVLSFLTTLITAVTIVNERLTGTLDQLQVTPATALEIVLGKLLPLAAVFSFDVLLMMLVAGVVLEVWPHGSAVFFLVVSSGYVVMSLALGLVISASSRTAAEAVQKTVIFSIPLVQLSGFVFPIRSMPAVLQWLTQLFPATHYIELTRAIYVRGAHPLSLVPELLWLAAFGALLAWLAVRTVEARG
jgi:ABC-2 type transport system permease protein